jgi:hypothetical protein
MADESKFKFISPGIFLNEIDQSQIPALPDAVGPVIIGRAQRGPAFAPTKVESFSEFVNTFGNPVAGNQQPGDVWRYGAQNAPVYAAYAAQAYLAAGVAPVTYLRLLGKDNNGAAASKTTLAQAGWELPALSALTTDSSKGAAEICGAYGLFYFGSSSTTTITGTLAAIFYASGAAIYPTGSIHSYSSATEGMNKLVDLNSSKEFNLILSNSAGSTVYRTSMEESNPNFIRNVFNTNPQVARFGFPGATSVEDTNQQKDYWLGESFERSVQDKIFANYSNYGVAIVPLLSGSTSGEGPSDRRGSFRNAQTPWFVSQDATTTTGSFDPTDNSIARPLFKFITLDGQGDYANKNIKISIDNINYSPNDNVNFGSFDVLVRDAKDSDLQLNVLERFSGVNLNPLSTNYIVNKIGDRYQEYDDTYGVVRTYGDMPNLSRYVRVVVSSEVAAGDTPSLLPFGYYGIPKYRNVFLSGTQTNNPNTYIVAGGYNSSTSVLLAGDPGTYATLTWTFTNYHPGNNNDTIRFSGLSGSTAAKGMGIILTSSIALADSSGSFSNYGSASIGILDSPHDDQIAAQISTLFSSLPAYDGTYTTPGEGSSTVTITATASVATDADLSLYTLGYVGVNGSAGTAAMTTGSATDGATGGATALTMSVQFPEIPTKVTSSAQGAANDKAFFGVDVGKATTNSVYNEGYVDYTRTMGASVISDGDWGDAFGLTSVAGGIQFQDAFTLDDVRLNLTSQYSSNSPRRNITNAYHESGSRAAGNSWTASGASGGTSYKNILDAGFQRFSAPMLGGFDGFSILERDPLRNNLITDGAADTTNYVYNTYQTALNILTDTEGYEFNVMSAPGLWYEPLTKKLIDVCEARGDCLGIIDLKGGYTPPHEYYYSNKTSRKGDLQTVLSNVDSRNLNNSYGAAYYPWVTIRDDVNNTILKAPPSVVALGVLANTERVADVWFAPAGFNRGGLSNGSAGIAVLNVEEKLFASDRDRLYARNINPVASFPAEGIVIFGQKTLQATQSALDRINVRRLLIYLKKGISRIASTVLFEQNIQTTWNDFKSRSDSFLGNVKVRFGVDDFRVVLDETTTTPDMIDRNIMYAKIFIKPTRSIEFIALDFIITRSGASFED